MAILSTKFESLSPEIFSIIAELSGKAPASLACISKNVLQSMQQYNEFYKNRLQTLSKWEGHPIDQVSGFYHVDPLLKKHRVDKNQSLALQVKALYECYRKRISEIDPLNQYHLSLDDLPKLFAYDKAFNKIQLWKKLPGGSEYLNSEPIRNLTLTEQASQLRAWLESHPAVVNSVHSLNLSSLKLTSIPEEIGLLTNLTSLNLSDNQISKIEHLNTLTQLQTLNLRTNQISKIENLDTLTQLYGLDLSKNQISKIENLDFLTHLKKLCLYNNQISKIENLDTLTQLTDLVLSNNQISKIENLDALTELLFLTLGNNLISKIQNLNSLTRLHALGLFNNQISKIENLDALTQLQALGLYGNQISKIENLSSLNQLSKLYLFNNPIRFTCDLLRHVKKIDPSSIILKAPYRSFISVAKKIGDFVLNKLGLDKPDQYLFGLD